MNKRQRDSQARRERVIEAASYYFSHHGYKSSSVERIAEKAGVSKALVFTFFASKRELYEHVLKRALEDWTEATEQHAADSDDTLELLKQLYCGVFEFMRRNPMVGGVLQGGDDELKPYLKPIKRSHDRWRKRLVQVLSDGVRAGQFRKDLDIPFTSDIIHTMQLSYITRILRRDQLNPVNDRLIAECANFIAHAVKHDSAA